jgi:hypothetical protein
LIVSATEIVVGAGYAIKGVKGPREEEEDFVCDSL